MQSSTDIIASASRGPRLITFLLDVSKSMNSLSRSLSDAVKKVLNDPINDNDYIEVFAFDGRRENGTRLQCIIKLKPMKSALATGDADRMPMRLIGEKTPLYDAIFQLLTQINTEERKQNFPHHYRQLIVISDGENNTLGHMQARAQQAVNAYAGECQTLMIIIARKSHTMERFLEKIDRSVIHVGFIEDKDSQTRRENMYQCIDKALNATARHVYGEKPNRGDPDFTKPRKVHFIDSSDSSEAEKDFERVITSPGDDEAFWESDEIMRASRRLSAGHSSSIDNYLYGNSEQIEMNLGGDLSARSASTVNPSRQPFSRISSTPYSRSSFDEFNNDPKRRGWLVHQYEVMRTRLDFNAKE